MSALTDLLVNQTNPVTALLIIGLFVYIEAVRRHDLVPLRRRVSRLEGAFIPDEPSQMLTDGGEKEDDSTDD